MAVGISALVAGGIIIASRHEGYPEREIVAERGTRWLVHRASGSLVLADGVSGRVMFRLDSQRPNANLELAQGPGGTFLLDQTEGTISHLDETNVQLEAERAFPDAIRNDPNGAVGLLSRHRIGVGFDGMIIAPPQGSDGYVVPLSGEIRAFDVGIDRRTSIVASDNSVWSLLANGDIQRIRGTQRETFDRIATADDTELTVLGERAVALSRANGTMVWYPGGDHVSVPNNWQAIDAVVQDATADEAPCAWIGLADQLLCLDPSGVTRQTQLVDVQITRSDRLMASDDTLMLIRSSGSLLRIDPTTGLSEPLAYRVADAASTSIDADDGSIWIDDSGSDDALVITGASVHVIDKLDDRAPTFSPNGTPVPGAIERGTDGPTDGVDPAGDAPISVGIQPDNDALDDPPVAVDDDASGSEGQELLIDVTANDYDPDGGAIFVESASQGANGRTTIVKGGRVKFLPAEGFFGEDTFSYTISDQAGFEATANVFVRIIRPGTPNLPPIASPDARQTAHRRAVVIDVLGNDIDPEQAPLQIGEINPPNSAEGSVDRVLLPSGRPSLRFTPSTEFVGGVVQFTYRAVDVDDAESELATVSIDVAAAADANRDPIAIGDFEQTPAGVPVTIDVLANDRDPDNDDLTIQRIDADSRLGTAVIVDNQIVYTPAPSTTGTVDFRYVITDRFRRASSAVVLVRILSDEVPNEPPSATADTREVFQDPAVIDVISNDIDPEGDALSVASFTQPDVGTVDQVDGRTLRYTPDLSSPATATTFTYVITDGHGHNDVGTVFIRLSKTPPGPPLAVVDNKTTPKNQPIEIDVLANDTDPSGVRPVLVGQPTCNSAVCTVTADGQINYAPNRDFVGTDTFSYRIRNSAGLTDTGTVIVTVTDVVGQNQPPVATPDDFKARGGETLILTPLSNDFDPERTALRIVSVSQPSDGSSVSIAADGQSLTFAARNAPGTSVNFLYEVADAEGTRATGRISVRILDAEAPRLPPTAGDDPGSLVVGSTGDFDVLANDVDPDGPTELLRVIETRLTAGAADVVVLAGREIRVTPAAGFVGEIRVVYTVADTERLTATGLLTILVTEPPNAAPEARDDGDSTQAGQAIVLAVLGNDVDPDGDELTIRLLTLPPAAAGTVVVTEDGKQVRFTPTAEFQGNADFSYVAVDERGLASRPAGVSINVLACAQSVPIVTDRLGEFTPFNTPLGLELLSPSQVDYTLTTNNVSGGTVSAGERPGLFVFVPTAGNNGGGSFGYVVENRCGASRSGRVAIDVNRAPRVNVAMAVQTEQDQSVTVRIDEVASDDEVILFTNAVVGTGSVDILDGGLALRFTPPVGYRGAPELRVTVADPGGLTTDATLRIIVNPSRNVSPVAFDDVGGASLDPGRASSIDVLANDNDPDGAHGDLRIQLMSTTAQIGAATANLSVSEDGRRVIVALPDGVHGTTSFSYRAIDASGATSEPAKVIIDANRKPHATSFNVSVVEGSSAEIDVTSAGNPDPDGDPVTIAGARTDNSLIGVASVGTRVLVTAAPDSAGLRATVLFSIVDVYGAWSVSTLTVDVVDN